MRKYYCILFLACSFWLNHHVALAKDTNMLIKTVDKENNALKAQIFRWWYSDNSGTKYQLECAEHACSEWLIRENISGLITLYAHASVVQENDKFCWDWYEGSIEIKADASQHQELILTLLYSNTVCK